MLPIDEFSALTLIVTSAYDLADAGNAEEGYLVLLLGLRHAKEAHAEGQGWGGELIARYEETCELFASRYGLGRA